MRSIPCLLIALVLLAACRKQAPVAARHSGDTVASYVGIGSLGGNPMNMLIVTYERADSTIAPTGYITYQSQTTEFSEIHFSGDTVAFRYARSGQDYQAWGLRQPLGIEVYFTEPSNLPPIRLNREIDGHNMSGIWTGDMSSTLAQGQQSVTLIMDQTGSVFTGEASTNFTEPWTFELSSGTVSGSSFTISGSVHGSDTYPTQWQGNYVGFDTISGVWNAGGEEQVDGGQYLFSRFFH